jgi:AcrR family transcriptional regulator
MSERSREPAPPRRQSRGERTRKKIKDAVIRLLDERDYFDLTITDICRSAKVATGGFYFHYEKKATLIEEMLREHSADLWAALEGALHYEDPYSAIHSASTTLVRKFRDSRGLVRCFNQLAMVDRTYVQLWEDAATLWIARLVKTLERARSSRREHISTANAHALLSLVDRLICGLYIERDPALVESVGPTDEVIENVAVLWYRALTGRSPPAARLAYTNRGLGI